MQNLCFLISFLCSSMVLLGAPKIDINKYIQSDFLTKEIELKDSFQEKKLKSLYSQKKQKFKYPSYNDFWRFTFEYWMVKNAKYLKWDQALENASILKEFQGVIKNYKLGIKKVKIFILPTSWISHFAIPRGDSEFYFFISQQFIKEASLNTQEASMVLLDEYVKLKKGYLMQFLQNTDFVTKLGKDFYLNKQPDIPSFEKLVAKVSYFFRFYGYQFNDAFETFQEIHSISQNKTPGLYQSFQQAYEKIYNKRLVLEKKFPRITGLYPSIMLYKSWFQK